MWDSTACSTRLRTTKSQALRLSTKTAVMRVGFISYKLVPVVDSPMVDSPLVDQLTIFLPMSVCNPCLKWNLKHRPDLMYNTFPRIARPFCNLGLRKRAIMARRSCGENKCAPTALSGPTVRVTKLARCLLAQTEAQARSLIGALCTSLESDKLVYLDPPATNLAVINLVQSLGMDMAFETARMYKGQIPNLPVERIYGITSFELG